MADTKISAMTNPGLPLAASVFPYVESGSNFICTKDELHEAAAGEDIFLTGATSQQCGIVNQASSCYLRIDDAGGLAEILGASGVNVISAAGVVIATGDGTSVQVLYAPVSPSNWASTAPNDMADAIDRLASAVAGLLLGPIP